MTTRAMRCTLAKLRGKAALCSAMISCTGFSGSSSPGVGQHFVARTFARLQALSGHTSPLPRAAVNNLWEMSNAGDLSADRKKYRRWTKK